MQGMSPEQLAAVSQQRFTPGQAASPADLARTADMLQVSTLPAASTQQDVQIALPVAPMHLCLQLHPQVHNATRRCPLTRSSHECNPSTHQAPIQTVQANPELMKQSLEMMRTMPAEQLQAAAQAAGAPPGFFSADRMEELAAQVHPRTAIKYIGNHINSKCHHLRFWIGSCPPQHLHLSCMDHTYTTHPLTLPSVFQAAC